MRYLTIPFMFFVAIAACLHASRALTRQETAMVLVARQDLPQGAVLGADIIDVKRIPRRRRKPGAFEVKVSSDVRAVSGLETAVAVARGEQLTRAALKPHVGRDYVPPQVDDKDDPVMSYLQGVKSFNDGDYARAREYLSCAVKLDPSNTDAAAKLRKAEAALAAGK